MERLDHYLRSKTKVGNTVWEFLVNEWNRSYPENIIDMNKVKMPDYTRKTMTYQELKEMEEQSKEKQNENKEKVNNNEKRRK